MTSGHIRPSPPATDGSPACIRLLEAGSELSADATAIAERLLAAFWRGELDDDGRSQLFTFELPRQCKIQRLTPDIAARLRRPLAMVMLIDGREIPTGEEAWIFDADFAAGGPAILVEKYNDAGGEWIEPIFRVDAAGEVWITIASRDGKIRNITTQERERKYVTREGATRGLIAVEENWMNLSNEHPEDLFISLSKRRVSEFGNLFRAEVIERVFMERSDLHAWARANGYQPIVCDPQPKTKKAGRKPYPFKKSVMTKVLEWLDEEGAPHTNAEVVRIIQEAAERYGGIAESTAKVWAKTARERFEASRRSLRS